jgi:hypothetical protein
MAQKKQMMGPVCEAIASMKNIPYWRSDDKLTNGGRAF